MSRNFDGVDDIILCGTSASIHGLGPLTYSVWINPVSTGENSLGRIMTSSSDVGEAGFRHLHLQNSVPVANGIKFVVNHNTLNLIKSGADGSATFGTWYNVAVTWDGGSANANVHIYKNGVELTYNVVDTQDGTGGIVSDVGKTFGLGNRQAGDRTFSGLIAYSHVYNRILTVGEINQVMEFPASITKGLVAFWPLWNGAVEPDYSGNQNNGTVTGALLSNSNPPINGVFRVPKPELSPVF